MMVSRLAIRQTLAYLFDWIVVIIVGGVGGVLYLIPGYHRPFSLTNIDIAYPDKDDIVSLVVLVLVSLVAPTIIIAVLSLASPILGFATHHQRRRAWAQVAWEVNISLLGLWAALAATLFITSGLKDMVGKPRPNLIARCDADLSKITGFAVGGFGDSIDSESGVLVTSGICRQTKKRLLDDGFAAFPSGHSSFSSAGMVYLSLWLCARFSLAIPYLDHCAPAAYSSATKQSNKGGKAAPPLWQLAAALFPIVVGLFVCSSRYADFHHAGFDIICGALLGTVIAWASFRLYHLPMRRARGTLVWGERSSSEAFFSSGSKFEEERRSEARLSERAFAGQSAAGDFELRDSEAARPTRASTQDSTAPIYQHHGQV